MSTPPDVESVAKDLLELLRRHHPASATRAELTQDLAVRMGHQIGVEGDDLDRLNITSLLHDIGKLGVAAKLLDRADELADDKQAAVARHPALGLAYLPELEGWLGEWRSVIEHHHLGWSDLQTLGLAPNITQGTATVAIASAYVAMTHTRPYGPTVSEATAELELICDPAFNTDLVKILAYVNKPESTVASTKINPLIFAKGSSTLKLAAAAAGAVFLAMGVKALADHRQDSQTAGYERPEVVITAPPAP